MLLEKGIPVNAKNKVNVNSGLKKKKHKKKQHALLVVVPLP